MAKGRQMRRQGTLTRAAFSRCERNHVHGHSPQTSPVTNLRLS
jgi:hypothetical protein